MKTKSNYLLMHLYVSIFLMFCLNITLIAREPICPPEDYPRIPYESKELDGTTDLSITVCLDDLSYPECQGCCITVYYFKRLIPAQNNVPKRVDIMLDYIENPTSEDCYWCNRIHADEIIELVHKKILEKHANEYGLKGQDMSFNHLVLRANCVHLVINKYNQPYEEICDINIESCCYKHIRFVMNQNSEITSYTKNGSNFYNWPNDFECPAECYPKCGQLAGLNLFMTHPKISIENQIKNKFSSSYNSNNDVLTIHSEEKGNLCIQIYTYTGIRLKIINMQKKFNDISIPLGIAKYPAGLYFCLITINGKLIFQNHIVN